MAQRATPRSVRTVGFIFTIKTLAVEVYGFATFQRVVGVPGSAFSADDCLPHHGHLVWDAEHEESFTYFRCFPRVPCHLVHTEVYPTSSLISSSRMALVALARLAVESAPTGGTPLLSSMGKCIGRPPSSELDGRPTWQGVRGGCPVYSGCGGVNTRRACMVWHGAGTPWVPNLRRIPRDLPARGDRRIGAAHLNPHHDIRRKEI